MNATITSQHIGDNGSKSKVHAMPNSDMDGRTAVCGRTVQWVNGNLYSTEHEITCLSCVKVMRKAEIKANTDRFITESDARVKAMEIEADHTEALTMNVADVVLADWERELLESVDLDAPIVDVTADHNIAMEDMDAEVEALAIVRTHAKELADSVMKSHETGSQRVHGFFLGDGVSFLTGTTKSVSEPLTRHVGEVMECVSTSAGISGTVIFRSYIIREYGTGEVFEITSGRVRMLDYGTWENTEAASVSLHSHLKGSSADKAYVGDHVSVFSGDVRRTGVVTDVTVPRVGFWTFEIMDHKNGETFTAMRSQVRLLDSQDMGSIEDVLNGSLPLVDPADVDYGFAETVECKGHTDARGDTYTCGGSCIPAMSITDPYYGMTGSW